MAPRKSDKRKIQVKVRRSNLENLFTIVPNALLRGDAAPYDQLSEYARMLLGAGLSCADEWDTTLDRIESWLPSLGRDRQEAVRRELREHGFLTMEKAHIAAGGEGGGRFDAYEITFYMEPLPVEQRDYLQPLTGKKRKTAGQTTPGFSGPGVDDTADEPDPEETAGQTMPGFSGPGSSGPGSSGHGSSGPGVRTTEKRNIPRSTKDQKNPPSSSGSAESPQPEGEEQGGNDLSEEEREQLNAAVIVAVDLRAGTASAGDWTRDTVAAAMRKQINAGYAAEDVAAAMVTAAEDLSRTHPGGIGYLLAKAAAPAPASPAADAAPPWVQGPMKWLPVGTKMCRTHPGCPAHACGGCKADALAVDADQGPRTVMAAQAARDAIRATNAAAAASRRAADAARAERRASSPEARPSALAKLDEAEHILGARITPSLSPAAS